MPRLTTTKPGTATLDESFTLDGYRSLLARTVSGLPPVGFEILGDPKLRDRRFSIIRHDIDISPPRALAVAKIEAEQGVRATYTVLLTGTFYSPFESATRDIILEIARLGHSIGLHFDASWHNVSDEAGLDRGLDWEVGVLRRLLDGVPIEMFSFHNTTDFTMACRAPRYGGLWNAYAGELQQNVSYVSDSNGHWRFHSWADALDANPSRLQVLTHPEWWTDDNCTAAERVCSAIEDRARTVWFDYSKILADAGRVNQNDIPEAFGGLPRLIPGAEGQDLVRLWLAGHREAAFVALLARAERVMDSGVPSAALDEARALRATLARGGAVEPAELRDSFESLAQILGSASRLHDAEPTSRHRTG